MNPYTEEVTCDICGGPGVATIATAASRWFGGTARHTDPEICRYYLSLRQEEIKRKEKELKDKEEGEVT